MLDQLKRLLRPEPVIAGSSIEVRPGIHLKAKPLIKMEYRVWREKEQRWEDAKPVDSVEVILS